VKGLGPEPPGTSDEPAGPFVIETVELPPVVCVPVTEVEKGLSAKSVKAPEPAQMGGGAETISTMRSMASVLLTPLCVDSRTMCTTYCWPTTAFVRSHVILQAFTGEVRVGCAPPLGTDGMV